ncbi:MerR family transcriptional regulator [Siminovitchia terrae]|uniref:MerR family transcriptional regulator n=1 Tax=Siminovitchia terrae TaxID=1914933 RepID=UPI001B24A6DF|nr:MerR family transcriptional regulator [Siminovitchia terrae]GIN91271.1 MerR family transcriptional regulator [Siminovitchia terrae]
MYTISEVSKRFNISQRTLRYYHEINLLIPNVNHKTNYRYYDDAHLIDLQIIISLKKMGMSLDQIKGMLEGIRSKNTNHRLENAINLEISVIDKEVAKLMNRKNKLLRLKNGIELNPTMISFDIQRLLEYITHNDINKESTFPIQNFSAEEIEILKGLPNLDDPTAVNRDMKELLQMIGHGISKSNDLLEKQIYTKYLKVVPPLFNYNYNLEKKYFDVLEESASKEAKVIPFNQSFFNYVNQILVKFDERRH